jgi:hypothetical protein
MRQKSGSMSSSWQPIPPADEEAIRAAWVTHLQPVARLVIPLPSRTWKGQALARHRERPGISTEFAGKLLTALRRCTSPGERLWIIEWQHAWFYLDPHAATDELPYQALPDGDACNIVAPDFRFGFVSGWRVTGPVTLFGRELLDAFASDPPTEFLRVCGFGRRSGWCSMDADNLDL